MIRRGAHQDVRGDGAAQPLHAAEARSSSRHYVPHPSMDEVAGWTLLQRGCPSPPSSKMPARDHSHTQGPGGCQCNRRGAFKGQPSSMRVGEKSNQDSPMRTKRSHDPSRAGRLHRMGAPAGIEPEDSFDAYLREIEVGAPPDCDVSEGEAPWSPMVRASLGWNSVYQEVFQAQIEACQGLMRAWSSSSSSPTPERLRHRR